MKKIVPLMLSLIFVFSLAIPTLATGMTIATPRIKINPTPVATTVPTTSPNEESNGKHSTGSIASEKILVPTMISGNIVDENGTQIKVKSVFGTKEIILNISPETYIIDAARGTPAKFDKRIDDYIVAYYGPAETKDLPPQSNAVAIICNIPQDYMVPHYAKVEAIEKGSNQVKVTIDKGSLTVTIKDTVDIAPFKTKNIVTINNINVGDDLLLWYDNVAMIYPGQTMATKVVILSDGSKIETSPKPISTATTKPTTPAKPIVTQKPKQMGVKVVDADFPSTSTNNKYAEGAVVSVTGNLPSIKGETDAVKKANNLVLNIFNNGMDKVGETLEKNGKGNVSFSYETIINDKFTSVVIHTSISAGNTSSDDVDTIVISNDGKKLYTLTDILGPNAYKLANKVISNQITNTEEGIYNTDENAFSGITSEPDFYIDKNMNVVIIFDKYSIAPGSSGTPTFVIPMDNVVNYEISIEKTYVKDNVTMIPLRPVAEALGYTVEWDAETQSSTVSKGKGSNTVTINSSAYGQKELEVAPELKEGTTYVPISFFEVILGDCYLVEDSIITFSTIN